MLAMFPPVSARALGSCAKIIAACLAGCLPLNDLSEYADDDSASPAVAHPGASSGGGAGSIAPQSGGSGPGSGSAPALPSGAAGADSVGADTQPLARPEIEADAGGPRAAVLTGLSSLQVSAGGVQRSFSYYSPVDLDPDLPAPVLIVAHGFGQSAERMIEVTRFDQIADREGFVVLYPEGQGRVPWNVGDDVCPGVRSRISSASGDDSAFLDAMLDFVAQNRRIDREHLFLSGFASGGYFANEIACQRPDIRAVASHSGGSHALDSCLSTRKPVLLLHGLADGTVPASCSEQARARWVARNGCGSDSVERAVAGGTCRDAQGCPADGQVSSCSFDDMGQGWAGGAGQGSDFLSYASASELIWHFFEDHAW